MWRRGNPPVVLVGMLIGAVTVENSMAVPQKKKKNSYHMIQQSHSQPYRLSYNLKRYMQYSKRICAYKLQI